MKKQCLVVFVENAFKHGVSQRVNSFIHIDITTDERWIVARFANSVYDKANGKHSAGIGLENVRKRLELIYGNNFTINKLTRAIKFRNINTACGLRITATALYKHIVIIHLHS